MSTKSITMAIVGAALIAALALFSQRAPQPGAVATREQSTPHQTDAASAAAPRTLDTAAAANEVSSRNEGQEQLAAPLSQPSPPAPITETLEDLKLPQVPQILETERAFAAEAVDATWSADAETHILGEIAQVTGLKLVTLRVECKTTLCRLHIAQQELGPTNRFFDFVDRLGMKPRFVVSLIDRNGLPTSLAYLERGSAARGGPTVGVDDIEIRRSKAE